MESLYPINEYQSFIPSSLIIREHCQASLTELAAIQVMIPSHFKDSLELHGQTALCLCPSYIRNCEKQFMSSDYL